MGQVSILTPSCKRVEKERPQPKMDNRTPSIEGAFLVS